VCQTPSKTQTNGQRDGQRDGRTDARNRIRCILALKCDVLWQYFNDFSHNQLTRIRVHIGWSQIFISLFLWSIDELPWQTRRTDTTERHDGQINKEVGVFLCKFVSLCLRWSLTHGKKQLNKNPNGYCMLTRLAHLQRPKTFKRSKTVWWIVCQPRRICCQRMFLF